MKNGGECVDIDTANTLLPPDDDGAKKRKEINIP
jgi:hypothetical protein